MAMVYQDKILIKNWREKASCQHYIETMLKPVSLPKTCSLAMPDCPADNQARQLALFLYGTLCTRRKTKKERIKLWKME